MRLDARWTSFGAVSRTWDHFWQGTPTAAPDPDPEPEPVFGLGRQPLFTPAPFAPDESDDFFFALT